MEHRIKSINFVDSELKINAQQAWQYSPFGDLQKIEHIVEPTHPLNRMKEVETFHWIGNRYQVNRIEPNGRVWTTITSFDNKGYSTHILKTVDNRSHEIKVKYKNRKIEMSSMYYLHKISLNKKNQVIESEYPGYSITVEYDSYSQPQKILQTTEREDADPEILEYLITYPYGYPQITIIDKYNNSKTRLNIEYETCHHEFKTEAMIIHQLVNVPIFSKNRIQADL